MFGLNPDPRVAFDLFGLEIYWYGLIITASIIIAFVLATLIMRKVGFRDEIVFEVLLIVVPFAIIGARFWYVLFEDGVSLASFFNFRDGGLAIYGAMMFGALALFIYTRFIRKCLFFVISDIVVLV